MTESAEISEMKREDIPELARIERECFSRPWTEEGFAAELESSTANFLTARLGGEIVGYMGFQAVSGDGYVDNIAVSPAFRRRGIARALLKAALSRCGELRLSFLSLEVRKSNEAAIALYRSFGFEVAGERRRFYRDPPEDAYIMTVYFES